MNCGQMLARTAPAAAGPSGPAQAASFPLAASDSKKKLGVAILFAALGLIALFGGLFATGALRFGAKQDPSNALGATGTQGGNTLNVTGEQPPNSLNVTGQTPPPNLQASNTKKYMPDDVLAWLKHLERIEKLKMAMAETQVAQAMQMMVALQAGGTMEELKGFLDATSGDDVEIRTPVEDTKDSAAAIRKRWQTLLDDFNSFPPPAECVPIRNEYDPVLRETGAMIGDIISAMENASQDRDAAIASLMKMRGKSGSIDRSAMKTDVYVQEICDKYDTRKWFKITSDVGGGVFARGGF